MLLGVYHGAQGATVYPTVHKTVHRPHHKECFKPDVSSAKVEALQPFHYNPLSSLVPLSNALLLSDSDGKMTASNQNAS